MSPSDTVYLKCVREGTKLRVKITSSGYNNESNCQFPRAIRRAGRTYSVPADCIKLCALANRKWFYRVSQPITIVDDGNDSITPSTTTSQRPAKVFTDEQQTECIVCMFVDKDVIYVPCGHFCACATCTDKLPRPACPMCRTVISGTVTPDQMV